MDELTIDGVLAGLAAAGFTNATFAQVMGVLAKQLEINALGAKITLAQQAAGEARTAAQTQIEQLEAARAQLQAELNQIMGQ